MKWRGQSRAALFNHIEYTELAVDIRRGIPKVDGDRQAFALETLSTRWHRLEQAVLTIDRANLSETTHADNRTVFISATAYNFLNVFLRPPTTVVDNSLTLSENPLHAIHCANARDALVLFGILSSRVAYWWWRAHGDGFHVTKNFVSSFPFGIDTLSSPQTKPLEEYGRALWAAIQSNPIKSNNLGRISIAFDPNDHSELRRPLDEALVSIAGLSENFVDELEAFAKYTIEARLPSRNR